MRTSKTDPIRVDYLPGEACPLPGRIGLTLAPGKKDLCGNWRRDLTQDLRHLRDAHAASLLVCLLQEPELSLLGIDDLWSLSRAAGIRTMHLPIPDGGVPGDVEPVVRLVRSMLAVAGAGDNVVIHCRGGLGRSGMLAACCLVALGRTPAEAVKIVRAARPGAVEKREQERFVGAFRRTWTDAPEVVPSVSRVLGCLLGGALGDALGYPVEFLRAASDIERVLGPVTPERLPRAKGGKALVSDDTQMTLFTAEGLIRAHHRFMDRNLGSTGGVLLHAYQRWLVTQTGEGAELWSEPEARGWLLDVPELNAQRAPGSTCLSALRATVASLELGYAAPAANDSKGCGAVMRSAPIGLVAHDAEAAFRMGCDAGRITHGHPSGYLSAGYFAAVVHGIAHGMTLREAMRPVDWLLARERGHEEVRRAVDAALALAAHEVVERRDIERLGGGWVGEQALAIALVCALTVEGGTADDVRAALWRAVAHGGDSDSTGSLTGNLLGAMFGVEVLPEAWLEELEMRATIERVARDLHATCVLGIEPEAERYPPW